MFDVGQSDLNSQMLTLTLKEYAVTVGDFTGLHCKYDLG